MQIKESKIELGDGVGVSLISDPKFKSNFINVRFLTEFSREKAAAFALIPQILTSTSSEYPDSSVMSRRLNALYGAYLGGYSRQRGGIYEMSVSISSLRDRFAIDGEQVFEEAAELLLGCIFNPVVENGGFGQTDFNVRKLNLLNAIDGEINDKISYALNLALETAYRGENSAERYYGSRDEVEALTPQRAYEVYKEVLETAKIEISFCGGGDFDGALKMFTDAFSKKRSCTANPVYHCPSPAKSQPEYAEQRLEVSQANLILVFKAENADSAAMKLFSSLYGETPFSKLFLNVREKLSLCYFCTSSFLDTKDSLTVVSGVAPENVNAAKDEILRQLSAIADGDFTDSELSDTKRAIETAYKSVYDRISRLDDWYFVQKMKHSGDSPLDKMQRILKLTREDVINAAKSLKLDTVFVLTNKD